MDRCFCRSFATQSNKPASLSFMSAGSVPLQPTFLLTKCQTKVNGDGRRILTVCPAFAEVSFDKKSFLARYAWLYVHRNLISHACWSCYIYFSSKGSDETPWKRRLICALAAGRCDKHQKSDMLTHLDKCVKVKTYFCIYAEWSIHSLLKAIWYIQFLSFVVSVAERIGSFSRCVTSYNAQHTCQVSSSLVSVHC